MSSVRIVLCLIFAIATVNAHTWLSCTKMVNGRCQGYIRNYKGRNTPAGVDDFYTQKDLGRTAGFPVCKDTQQQQIYTAEYPMATAYPGEVVNVMYTPNGHSQPGDRGLQTTSRIHWTGKTNTQLVTREDLTAANKIGEWNYGSNCATSGDVASLPCVNGFTIPAGTPAGVYQVVWYWPYDRDQNQRPLGEEYFSCFDVNVLASGNAVETTSTTPTTQTQAPTQATTQTQNTQTTNTGNNTPTDTAATSNQCANILAECKSFCGDTPAAVCECDPVTGKKSLQCGEDTSSATILVTGIPLALIALMNLL